MTNESTQESEPAAERGFVQRMLDDHESGRHDYKRSLYSLLTFEVWHELFIRSATREVTA